MLSINDVISPVPYKKTFLKGTSRYLGVDENNDAYFIRIDNGCVTAPFKKNFVTLIDMVKKGDVVVEIDYNMGLPVSLQGISESQRKDYEENKALLKPLWDNDNKELLFDYGKRKEVILNITEKSGKNQRTVERLYYRYLGCGLNLWGLVPKYSDRGGVGKPQISGARRGVKSKTHILPRYEVRPFLEKGVEKFLLRGNNTVKEAFVKTLKKYFNNGINFHDKYKNELPLEEILSQSSQLPTYRIFYDIALQNKKIKEESRNHPRRSRQTKTKKEQRGTVLQNVRGPGFRFEIDSTKLQIQLVSRFGRENLIGSVILYLVVDVWSSAIVGYVISLESAGWPIAAKALKNCFQKKEEIFRRLGLPYSNKDWPSYHLPVRLLADRGELIGLKPEILIENCGITIEFTPPEKPEWKPVVERAFRSVKHGDFYNIPGKYPKFPKRREPDGKNTAALNISEIEFIVVEMILDINNRPVGVDKIPLEMLKIENPDITRIGLYKWGLENRPGFTRTLSERDVFTYLLTQAQGSVTSRGILYKGQTYVSKRLSEIGYLSEASRNGRFKIDIRYDEHNADQLWFYDQFLEEWAPAVNDNEEIYRLKAAFYELEVLKKEAKALIEKADYENIHRRDEKSKSIKKIVETAKKEAKNAKSGNTKTQNKSNIREHKFVEKHAERLSENYDTIASHVYGIDNARSNDKPEQKSPNNEGKYETKPLSQMIEEQWDD